MSWKWIGRIVLIVVAYLGAETYASSTVLSRITAYQETLIAPDGSRVPVLKNVPLNGPRRTGQASIVSVEGVSFGYRVTYALPSRPRLVCTYRLPGLKCEDGWTVIWSQPARRY